jgi:hypothetical protein
MLTKVYSGERPSILVSTNPKTDQIDPVAIFVELNKLFPSTIHFENIKLPEAKKYFKDKYKLLPENIIEKSYPIHTDGKIQNILFQVCYLINRDLIIFSRDGRDDIYTFIIFYCHTSNQEIIKELTDFFNSNYVDKRMSEIGIIGNNCNGLFIRFFNIKIPDIKISDYYNNDFSMFWGLNQPLSPIWDFESHDLGILGIGIISAFQRLVGFPFIKTVDFWMRIKN